VQDARIAAGAAFLLEGHHVAAAALANFRDRVSLGLTDVDTIGLVALDDSVPVWAVPRDFDVDRLARYEAALPSDSLARALALFDIGELHPEPAACAVAYARSVVAFSRALAAAIVPSARFALHVAATSAARNAVRGAMGLPPVLALVVATAAAATHLTCVFELCAKGPEPTIATDILESALHRADATARVVPGAA
jgi:hypothetical protein